MNPSADPLSWETLYQSGETPWEKGGPAPPLLGWAARRGWPEGEILVPGCGFGHDVRALAAGAPRARVTGLDLAPSALAVAAGRYPAAGQESYRQGDLFALPADLRGRFDWVFEHTCFCAIPPVRRADYVDAVAGALRRPGGQLLAIFYLDPWNQGEEPAGGGPPFGTSEPELETLFLPRFELVERLTPAEAFPGREKRERLYWLRLRPDPAAGAR